VDHNDGDALARLLEANNVETLISALNSETYANPEWALFRAAEKASTVKRSIPSIWDIEYTEKIATYFPSGQGKLGLIKALDSATWLETTIVLNGFFTDYFVALKVPSCF
jgi:hypothetical protein